MNRQSLCADDLRIIEKYSDMVYRMAYSMVKSKYDAEDIHQEVFVRYITKRPKFESTEHEKAWFLRVTVNLCKNLWKTAWVQKVTGLGENKEAYGAYDKTAEEEQERDFLIDMVKQLPAKYRAVIHLFYYEELSTEEIAGVLNRKPSTVRTQLTRARELLKELLEEQN